MTEKPIFVSGGHKYYVAYFQDGNLIIHGNKNPLNQLFSDWFDSQEGQTSHFEVKILLNQLVERLKYGADNRKYESEERIVFN